MNLKALFTPHPGSVIPSTFLIETPLAMYFATVLAAEATTPQPASSYVLANIEDTLRTKRSVCGPASQFW